MALAETAQLAVKLSLKGDFKQGMGQAQKQLAAMDKSAGGLTGKLGGIARDPRLKDSILTGVGLGGGLVGFQMLTSAISGTIDVIGQSIQAAAEEEAAIAQLSKAIEQNDDAWDGNIDAIEELIRQREKLAFSDDEQRESLRLLVAFTKDAEEAQRVLGTAMDFARLRGIDLRTASDVLGKAIAGNSSLLGRYGVIVRKGADATEVLAKVQDMAAGQAAAYADTTQGKFVRAQLALNNAMEDLGATLLPIAASLAELAADTIPGLVGEAQKALKPVADLAGGFDDLLTQAQKVNDTIKEKTGRDLAGDFANFTRIVATGGTVIAIDRLDQIQDGLQGIEDTIFGHSAPAYDVLSSVAVDAYDAIERSTTDSTDATLANTQAIIRSVDAYDEAEQGIARMRRAQYGLNDALAVTETSWKQEQKAIRGLIRTARELDDKRDKTGKHLRDLTNLEDKLLKEQARAAEQGAYRKVAALQRAIDKVRQEKRELQASMDLARAIQALPTIKLSVQTVMSGVTGMVGKFFGAQAAGGPYQALRAHLVGEQGPELRVERQAGYTHSAAATRRILSGGERQDVSVYVSPRIEVSAATIERRTSKSVRTNRVRSNV